MKRPLKLDLKMARYLMLQKAKRRKRFPFVTMLEPLEACNLHCIGCGRVIEYKDVMDKRLSIEESLSAVHASGAPIVSISGGEPLLHEHIEEIVRAILAEKRFIYLCTNGLLVEEKLDLFKPNPYFSFVVHLDGTKKIHDSVTQRV
ncbi:MAG: radical SAM protein, partial [Candidatus Bipolaricaulota bacterium]